MYPREWLSRYHVSFQHNLFYKDTLSDSFILAAIFNSKTQVKTDSALINMAANSIPKHR